MVGRKINIRMVVVCGLLALGTILLYGPAITFDFLNYDDQDYVLNNFHINRELTWRAVAWCFQAGYASNWHPVTWLSHLLDCQLYGLRPGGHHAANILLHTANAVLLFLLLRRMTGAFWRSAAVAALFAWHPLHVESVAWVAERKDVLSAFFFILTGWAYLRYGEASKGADNQQVVPTGKVGTCCRVSGGRGFYALALGLFALGLMAKPMVVTLPFALLLLDWWPLGRLAGEDGVAPTVLKNPKEAQLYKYAAPTELGAKARPDNSAAPTGMMRAGRKGRRDKQTAPTGLLKSRRAVWVCLYEKVPFLALSVVSCVLTVYAQHRGGSIQSLASESVQARVSNSLVAYVQYLGKIAWPAHLAVIYPLNKNLPVWEPVAAGLLLLAITAAVAYGWRTRPYFLVGWLWYLGTLVPVIGLVQVGGQAIADRYTYIPSIGIFIALSWGVYDLCAGLRGRDMLPHVGQNIGAAVAGVALGFCILLTSRQVQYWKNSETLFRHALEVTPDKTIAHATLGAYYLGVGKLDQARAECEAAIQCDGAYPPSHLFLGHTLLLQGKPEEAAVQLLMAIDLAPWNPYQHFIYGQVLMARKLPVEASAQFEEMLRSDPGNPDGRFWLGKSLAAQGKWQEACAQYNEALRVIFQYPEAHVELAMILSEHHQTTEAISHYRSALQFSPNDARALNNLAWILATDPHPEIRDGAEAVKLAERACMVTRRDEPFFLGTLADAYAEAGRFDDAVKTGELAHDLAARYGMEKLAARNLELLETYRSHQAYHEK